MCDPVSLAVAAASIAAATSVASGYSEASALRDDASVDRENARTASRVALEEEGRVSRRNTFALGDLKARQGASGAVSYTGSAADVYDRQAAELELDALTVRFGGEQQRKAFMTQYRQKRQAARSAVFGGFANAAADILGGAAKASQLGG